MNFFTKYKAINIAKECTQSAIEAGGSNPTDHKGGCLLPIKPMEGDLDYFQNEMSSWCTSDWGSQEEKIFCDTYTSIMEKEAEKYQ